MISQTKLGKNNNDMEQDNPKTLEALIGEKVIYTLGEPSNLLQLQVRQLWKDHYRVNILVGMDAATARVAASYFVVVDEEGAFTSCSPAIERKY